MATISNASFTNAQPQLRASQQERQNILLRRDTTALRLLEVIETDKNTNFNPDVDQSSYDISGKSSSSTSNLNDAQMKVLQDTIKEIEEQHRQLKDLHTRFKDIRFHSEQDLLGVKKGKRIVTALEFLSLISFLSDAAVLITVTVYDYHSIPVIAPLFISATVTSIVISGITALAWWEHEKNQDAFRESQELNPNDIEDTRALLKLLREWQKVARAKEVKTDEFNALLHHSLERDCFQRLNDLPESIFQATKEREVWASALIRSIPDLRDQLEKAHQAVQEQTVPDNTFSDEISTNSETDVGSRPSRHHVIDIVEEDNFDIEAQKREESAGASDNYNSISWQDYVAEKYDNIEKRIGGKPLKYLVFRGQTFNRQGMI